MKIKSVRARVFEWKGKTVPPQGNFCSNAMDLAYDNRAGQALTGKDTMKTFRFHGWTVVEVETDDGRLLLQKGGSVLRINDDPAVEAQEREYPNLYARFEQLVRQRKVDVDAAPLRLVADAFMCGRRTVVAPFHE